jgi:hypothetical protein
MSFLLGIVDKRAHVADAVRACAEWFADNDVSVSHGRVPTFKILSYENLAGDGDCDVYFTSSWSVLKTPVVERWKCPPQIAGVDVDLHDKDLAPLAQEAISRLRFVAACFAYQIHVNSACSDVAIAHLESMYEKAFTAPAILARAQAVKQRKATEKARTEKAPIKKARDTEILRLYDEDIKAKKAPKGLAPSIAKAIRDAAEFQETKAAKKAWNLTTEQYVLRLIKAERPGKR